MAETAGTERKWILRSVAGAGPSDVVQGKTFHGDMSAQLEGVPVPRRWFACDLSGTFNWPDLPAGTEFVDCNLMDASFEGKSLVNLIIRGTSRAVTATKALVDGLSFRGAEIPGLRLFGVYGDGVVLTDGRFDGGQIKNSILPNLQAQRVTAGVSGEPMHCCEGVVMDGCNWTDANVPGICFERSVARGSESHFTRMLTSLEKGARRMGGIFWSVVWTGAEGHGADFKYGHFGGANLQSFDIDGTTQFAFIETDDKSNFEGIEKRADQWQGVHLTSGLIIPKQRRSERRQLQRIDGPARPGEAGGRVVGL